MADTPKSRQQKPRLTAAEKRALATVIARLETRRDAFNAKAAKLARKAEKAEKTIAQIRKAFEKKAGKDFDWNSLAAPAGTPALPASGHSSEPLEVDAVTAAFLLLKQDQLEKGLLNLSGPMTAEDWRRRMEEDLAIPRAIIAAHEKQQTRQPSPRAKKK